MLDKDSVIRACLDALTGKEVKVITRNGYQLSGRLDAWDSSAMLISISGTDTLVLMGNVSTVIPVEH